MHNVYDFFIEGPVPNSLLISLKKEHCKKKASGGHSIFLGQIRNDKISGKEVTAIEYSAYPEMAEKKFMEIVKSIYRDFEDVHSVEIIHSLGKIPAGEISLLVFVSAGHRKQAFQAVEKIVDLIKENVPIWKKEFFKDDTRRWKQ